MGKPALLWDILLSLVAFEGHVSVLLWAMPKSRPHCCLLFWLHGVLSFRCDKCLCSLTAVHQTLQTVRSANRKTVLCLSCRGRPWALPRCNLQQWWEYVWVMLTVLAGRINEVYRKMFECFVFDKCTFMLWKTTMRWYGVFFFLFGGRLEWLVWWSYGNNQA